MKHPLEAAEFLHASSTRVLLDVRSPGEYAQGHIPGAHNLALFTDEERAVIGTFYKQQGKEAAVLRGLRFVGPKMESFVRDALALAQERRLAVYCWRGGQRSQSMTWLFRQTGFDVVTLHGGYKQYRRHILEQLGFQAFRLIVIGGQTGSGKTKVLHALQQMGEQIIDLEALAHHKGSSFGSIGESPQPTPEQFENDLYSAINGLDANRRIWIENESRSIGRVYIPDSFWVQMKNAPLFNIQVPLGQRIQNLVADYTGYSPAELENAFWRIEKKLGGQHLKAALEALHQSDFAAAAAIALKYYDKTYRFGLEQNTAPDIRMLVFGHGDPDLIARACLETAGQSAGKNLETV